MTDAPTPLDLDAIVAAIAECRTYNFGMYQADRLAHEHAPALVEEVKRLRAALAEVERLTAEVATERAEVTRLRTMVGDCHCDKNPETTNGPEEDCPQHGRPVAEVWDIVKGAEAGWDRARAEVDRLCAEARLANASAHSAGLALGARLDHPHGGFPEGTWIAEQFDAARPAPAWDEEATRVALVDAQLASVQQVMEDGYPSIFVRSNEDAADVALAVVRDNQPVKPRRETVRDEIAGHPIGSGYYATTVGVDEAAEIADAVLSLLPGRSEAEVKAESKAEAWDEGAIFGIRNQHGTVDVYIRDAIERHNPYRLAAEGGADRG